eukprot:16451857-Heterocapsa_arctica.AAC.1
MARPRPLAWRPRPLAWRGRSWSRHWATASSQRSTSSSGCMTMSVSLAMLLASSRPRRMTSHSVQRCVGSGRG